MKYIALAFLIFFSEIGFAQPTNRQKLLDAGVAYFNAEKIDSAILCWQQVLVQFKEIDPEYGRAMLNLGVANEAKGDYKTSMDWYKTMLLVELDDRAPGFEEGEQFASYKHTACMRLATMFALEGKYREAIRYVNFAEHPHAYQTENGGDFEHRQVVLAKWKATFYLELGHPDSALHVLAQKLFDREIAYRLPTMRQYSFDDFYAPILPMALEIIDKMPEGRSGYKQRLDKAIKNIKSKKTADGATVATFVLDKFIFRLGTLETKPSKDFFIEGIKTSDLYMQLK